MSCKKLKLGPDTPVRRFEVGRVKGRTDDGNRPVLTFQQKDKVSRNVYYPVDYTLTRTEARGVVQGLEHLLKTKAQKLEVLDPTSAEVARLEEKVSGLESQLKCLVSAAKAAKASHTDLLGFKDTAQKRADRMTVWAVVGWVLALVLEVGWLLREVS